MNKFKRLKLKRKINQMASTTNTNPLLEHLEDGKIYDLDLGETWNSINDGNTSKYAYHTIKCMTIIFFV